MKTRYIAVLAAVIAMFLMFANANTDDLKNTFFNAESLLDASAVTLFDGTCEKDMMTEFFVETESEGSSLNYFVYADISGKYYLESPDNFLFTVLTDASHDELIMPLGVIKLFNDSAKWHNMYSGYTDGFRDALKKSASENDFFSETTYVKQGGLRKKCEKITLDVKGERLFSEIKKYLSSEDFFEMINTVYGTSYNADTMANYADSIMPDEYLAIIYRRNIVAGKAIEETATVVTKNNTYRIEIKNNVSRDTHTGEITMRDSNGTLDMALSYKKDKYSENLSVKNKDTLIEITKDVDGLLYIWSSDKITQRIKITKVADYTPQNEIYDMNIPQNQRVMFTRLGGWLKSNSNAALLFRTYEVDL